MKNNKTKAAGRISLILALMMLFSSVQFNFNFVHAAVEYDFAQVLEKSNFPVINIKIENGESPDKVDKEHKSNAEFEIRNTAGKGEDFSLSAETKTEDGEKSVAWPMTIKGRGNSTWHVSTGKKPYNIKFEKAQDLLGMGESKSWSLLANWMDTTFIRNYLAYKTAKKLNTNAMDCELVELCINGKYEGLYLLTEKYGIGDTRVVTAGDGRDVDGDGEVTKYLIEADGSAESNDEPNRFQTDSGIWFVIKEPDEDEIVSEADPRFEHIRNLLQMVDDAIMNDGDYERYIDVDSFIDVYIIEELTKNPDFGFGYQPVYGSTFLYAEEGGKLCSGPVWDFDISMGRTDYRPQNSEGYRDTLNPHGFLHKKTKWIAELFKKPEFEQKVKERWSEVSTVLEETIDKLLAETVELVRPSAAMDYMTWGQPSIRMGGWEGRVPLGYAAECEHMENFLAERIRWLDSQWLIEDAGESGNELPTGTVVCIAGAVVLSGLLASVFLLMAKRSKKRKQADDKNQIS